MLRYVDSLLAFSFPDTLSTGTSVLSFSTVEDALNTPYKTGNLTARLNAALHGKLRQKWLSHLTQTANMEQRRFRKVLVMNHSSRVVVEGDIETHIPSTVSRQCQVMEFFQQT
ncbi:hypothetical protein HZ326_25076 [Fusarium oxysporum f. sp. albedinis]|nr:hypothetical protein HZ326_25076 [Fusarium oxysporum f. sp. albedinis]